MTSKENVLNIYPEAELSSLKSWRDGRKVPLSIYLVKINAEGDPYFKLKRWREKMYTIAVGSTPEMAWEKAWTKIQERMLKKLENDC